MAIPENKQTVERFDPSTAACEAGALDEICGPDMTNHALASHRSGGLEATKRFLCECRRDRGKAAWAREIMGDLDVVAIAEGDYVIQFGRRTGSWPGGRFRGVDIGPGGYRYEVAFMYRFKGGRIAERWAVRDDLGRIQRLGGRRRQTVNPRAPGAERERRMSGKAAHNLPTHTR